MKEKIRPIAIYLPQFHPIKENDEWWGRGFTDWNNVVKAKPRFKGHYQPHLPADLGFYDLRLPETRQQQADLAAKYGIYGFCYYHYWFTGKRLLEKPLDAVVESGKPDFPFCLCWANENWARTWDGQDKQLLIKQDYSVEDDINHIHHLIRYFKDERYIKVDGKPVFIIYKPDLVPNISDTINRFREEAAKFGLELYICRFERVLGLAGEGINELGFDAAIEFQPLSHSFRKYIDTQMKLPILKRIARKGIKELKKIFNLPILNPDRIVEYRDFVDFDLAQPRPSYKCFPGVSPSWDNSCRRVNINATIFKNSTPEDFAYWYHSKIRMFEPYSDDENFIFINAWNEWGEGNHLEPCQKWGLQYLDALL